MCKDLLQAQLSCNHLVINILQNLLFCIAKQALLYGKKHPFVTQKHYYCLLKEIIFTKQKGCFYRFSKHNKNHRNSDKDYKNHRNHKARQQFRLSGFMVSIYNI